MLLIVLINKINLYSYYLLIMKTLTNYEQEAIDLLVELNTVLEIQFIENHYYWDWDKEKRDIYRFTFKNPKGEYSDRFWQSIAHSRSNKEGGRLKAKKPTEYDVLACLTTAYPWTFKDFCNDYGYNSDSIKAMGIYNKVLEEYNGLSKIFTPEQLEKIWEIR